MNYKKQLNHCTLPISTISVDGVLYGYEMYYEEFFKTYKLYEIAFDNEQLLHFLKSFQKDFDILIYNISLFK